MSQSFLRILQINIHEYFGCKICISVELVIIHVQNNDSMAECTKEDTYVSVVIIDTLKHS